MPTIRLSGFTAEEVGRLSKAFGIPVHAEGFDCLDFKDSEAGKSLEAWVAREPALANQYSRAVAIASESRVAVLTTFALSSAPRPDENPEDPAPFAP